MGQNNGRRDLFFWAIVVLLMAVNGAPSRGATPATLSGMVTSSEEGKMEGVLVGAKKEGSNVTVTVVSDSQGSYAFPEGRLSPGTYRLRIRATGYELPAPTVVTIEAKKTARLNLRLRKTTNIAPQLTATEFLMNMPGAADLKNTLRWPAAPTEGAERVRGNPGECVLCHSLTHIFRSRHNPEEFAKVLARMRIHMDNQSKVTLPGPMPPSSELRPTPEDKILAAYLSSINMSSGTIPYKIKPLPRPTGRSTRVIMTEYDLPRPETLPHDAIVDHEGNAWYGDHITGYFGRVNGRTGEVREWPIPVLRQGNTAGVFDMKLDKDGNPLITLRGQGGIGKFDRKTEKFTTWRPPAEDVDGTNRIAMVFICADGRVWFRDVGKSTVYRLDRQTGQVVGYPEKGMNYGIEADSRCNLYGANLGAAVINELNPETGQWTTYPTPTPQAGPRRTEMDRLDRLWFGENYAGKVGVFDTKTKQMKEWTMPAAPWNGSYSVIVDKNDEVWAGSNLMDRVFRLNPATGQVTQYVIPTVEADFRRVDVDNSTTPVTIWASEFHAAKVVKIEPLD